MGESRVVPKALDETDYKIWSNCMKMYFVSQDLWVVIERETKKQSSMAWKRKNASALHAIHMSCGAEALVKIGELESAKEAWDLLKSIYVVEDDAGRHTNVAPAAEGQSHDALVYRRFEKATKQGEWNGMKAILDSHQQENLITMPVVSGKTALHYLLKYGNTKVGGLLLDEIKQDEDLELTDDERYTAFAYLSSHNQRDVLQLLERMFARNASLPNIGDYYYNIPVVITSSKGYKDTTRYLYTITDKSILNPELGNVGVHLLINCINIRLFDIAYEIVTEFPKILRKKSSEEMYPIHALAKSLYALKRATTIKKPSKIQKLFPSKFMVQRPLGLDEETVEESDKTEACEFLRLVCTKVSGFDETMLEKYVYEAMIEASKNGTVELVSSMLVANPKLIEAHVDKKSFIWHAIKNRQAKVYNLIYCFIGRKDYLLSCPNPEEENILHVVAKFATPDILDQKLGPALQMQREVRWFQEVWSLADPRYREVPNEDGLTPSALFSKTHKELMDAGELAMKDAARSSMVVGALIITTMFATTFTVTGGNNRGDLPKFMRKYGSFLMCTSTSIFLSITSVVSFLGILMPRNAGKGFLLEAPIRFGMGLYTLSMSLLMMMFAFCSAIGILFDGSFLTISPIYLIVFSIFCKVLYTTFPPIFDTFRSTSGRSIFDKNPKLLDEIKKKAIKEEGEKTSVNQSIVTRSSTADDEV